MLRHNCGVNPRCVAKARGLWCEKVAMVRSCSAVGCTNRDTSESCEKGIKFYRIPADGDRRSVWLAGGYW